MAETCPLCRGAAKPTGWSGDTAMCFKCLSCGHEFGIKAIIADLHRQLDAAKGKRPEWSNGKRCDTCGAWLIDGPCLRCGAPQCCPQCCQLTAERERRERYQGQVESSRSHNMHLMRTNLLVIQERDDALAANARLQAVVDKLLVAGYALRAAAWTVEGKHRLSIQTWDEAAEAAKEKP